MSRFNTSEVSFVASVVKDLVRFVGSETFMEGLYNAFNHGALFKEINEDFSDEKVKEIFRHFRNLIELTHHVDVSY